MIYGQPYRELEIIALAKAYQDVAGFHLPEADEMDQPATTAAYGVRLVPGAHAFKN